MARYGKRAQQSIKPTMHKRKKEGDAQKRKEREAGEESQAGDRDRAFESSTQGGQGSEKERGLVDCNAHL